MFKIMASGNGWNVPGAFGFLVYDASASAMSRAVS